MMTFNTRRAHIFAALALTLTVPLVAQNRVDLRSWQTPLKNQGPRTTCISFSAIAALEAAYKRQGYGNLDLSEEFATYVGKMFWLHPSWTGVGGVQFRGPNGTENQLGAVGGGNGTGVMESFKTMRVPRESDMPYRSSNYVLPRVWNDSYWNVQANVNTFNLDTNNLPRRALTARAYYGVRSSVRLSATQARSTSAIEAVLRGGREVVWDFLVGGTQVDNQIWRPSAAAPRGGHSMLIVGYDRTAQDPRDHYFIVKNSWGSGGAMSTTGFTRISYPYLRTYGFSGGYITSVQAPARWPELAFLGRRNMSYDGWKGTLDIYHLPGMSQQEFDKQGLAITDRRLGTFTDSRGRVYRVNGEVRDNVLVCWFNTIRRNIRWDRLRYAAGGQRRFTFVLTNSRSGEMAGYHFSNPGSVGNPSWGNYARVPSSVGGTNGFLRPVPNRSSGVGQFVGRWAMTFDETYGYLNIYRRNDNLVPSAWRRTWYGLDCEFVETRGRRVKCVGYVSKVRPDSLRLSFFHSSLGYVSHLVYAHSWERGVVSGTGFSRGKRTGVLGYRTGDATNRGSVRLIGAGCYGSNRRKPVHYVIGTPEIGNTLQYQLHLAKSYSRAYLTFGSNVLQSGVSLRGAPGCKRYSTPGVFYSLTTDRYGYANYRWRVPNLRHLIGRHYTSQFEVLDPWQNAAGRITSNAYLTRMGGPR